MNASQHTPSQRGYGIADFFHRPIGETMLCALGSRRFTPCALVLCAAIILGAPKPAFAAESHVFTAKLLGDPEVGCIVTTEDVACAKGRLSGTLVPDGDSSLAGQFDFNLPGLREGARRPLRRVGRGRVRAVFTPADSEKQWRCLIKGRVRSQGVLLPAGSSARLFHTGVFEGRGRCESKRVRLQAIWSGSIGPVSEPMILDFERFQGRLAGTLLFR